MFPSCRWIQVGHPTEGGDPETGIRRGDQELVRVTYKKPVKQAQYVTSYANRKDIKKNRPSGEIESGEPSKKRRRVTPKMKCFMTGCNSMNKHMKKHVIGKHLPTEAYSRTEDLPLGSPMRILEDLLNKIAHHLGCEDLRHYCRRCCP